jgi:hypothetical protein
MQRAESGMSASCSTRAPLNLTKDAEGAASMRAREH